MVLIFIWVRMQSMDIRIVLRTGQSAQAQVMAASQLENVTDISFTGDSPSAQIDLTPLRQVRRITFKDILVGGSVRHIIFPSQHVHVTVHKLVAAAVPDAVPVPGVDLTRNWNSTLTLECLRVESYASCFELLNSVHAIVNELSVSKYIDIDYTHEQVCARDWRRASKVPLLTMRQVATHVPDEIGILATVLRAELFAFSAFARTCADTSVARTYMSEPGCMRLSFETWQYSPLPFLDIAKDTMVVFGREAQRPCVDAGGVNHLYMMYQNPTAWVEQCRPYAVTLHGNDPDAGQLALPGVQVLMLRYHKGFRLAIVPSVYSLIVSDSRLNERDHGTARRLDSLTLHASSELFIKYMKHNLQSLAGVTARSVCLKIDCPCSDETVQELTLLSRTLTVLFGTFQLCRENKK